MEPLLLSSVPDAYDVYLTEDGTQLIVLEGLSLRDPISPPPIQEFMHDNYAFFLSLYLVLLVSSLFYVATKNVFLPVYRQFRYHQPNVQ